MLVVDSTLAPPVICRPLEHGADLVLHSATKYFGGHSDVTGGVVTGHPELIRRIRSIRIDTGGSLAPDDSYLLRRGLETLPLRVRRQCATAQTAGCRAGQASGRPDGLLPGADAASQATSWPAASSTPGPEGTRFGAIVTVAPYGGQEAGHALRRPAAAGQAGRPRSAARIPRSAMWRPRRTGRWTAQRWPRPGIDPGVGPVLDRPRRRRGPAGRRDGRTGLAGQEVAGGRTRRRRQSGQRDGRMAD